MAAKVKVSFGNTVREFQSLTKNTSKNVQKEIEALVRKTALEVVRDVKRFTPVRTGALRDAWKFQKRGSGRNTRYEISNSKKYATYIENGTRYIVPRRMLARALSLGENRLRKRLKQLERRIAKDFNR